MARISPVFDIRIRIALLSLSLLLSPLAALSSEREAGSQPKLRPATTLREMRVIRDGGQMVATMELDGAPQFTAFTLPQPERIVIDLKATQQTIGALSAPDDQIMVAIRDGGLERVRIGQMNNHLRIVFDTATRLPYHIEKSATRLIVRLGPVNAPAAAAAPGAATVPPAPAVVTAQAAGTAPVAAPASVASIPVSTRPRQISPPPLPQSSLQQASLQTSPQPKATPAPATKKSSEPAVTTKAGKKNFSEGLKYEARQKWDLAAQHFTVAVTAEPDNPEYRLHLIRARQNASLMLTRQGDSYAAQQEDDKALQAWHQAVAYDQTNEEAQQKMDRLLEQLRNPAGSAELAKQQASNFNVAIRGSKRSPRELMQVISFREASLRQVVEGMADQLGLNVMFDESFRDDTKFQVRLRDVTMARALDQILIQTKHLFEQLDRRTILVYQDTPQNRQRFEQLLVRTFYLGNAELEQARALVQGLIGPQRQVLGVKQLNALVVRDTARSLQMVEELLNNIDKNRAEVVIDVDIYEVSRTASLEIGNQLALTAQPSNISIGTGADGRPVMGNSASLGNLGGVGRASVGAIVGNTVSPVLGGVGTIIGLPPTTLSLLQSKGHSKLLASTQIHALDGEQNQTKVGRSVPVRLGTTYMPGFGATVQGQGTSVTGNFGAFDSVQYKDVGLIIDVTPAVAHDGYVQIRMRLESSNVEASGADLSLTPSFTQRALTTIARVKDGQTAVVAGVKQEAKGESKASLPVIGMIPILGRFITTPRQQSNLSDIVITVTPHILRATRMKPEDHLARLGGTFTAGVTQSVEDVVHRAEADEDQERRVSNAPPLVAASALPDARPTDAGEIKAETAAAAPAPVTPVQANQPLPPSPVSDSKPTVDLSLMPTMIEPGVSESFYVVVSLNGQVRINDAQVSLRYDPALIRFNNVRSGGLLGGQPNITHQAENGRLKIRVQQTQDREAPVSAFGQLLLLEFTALQPGRTAIEFAADETELRRGGKLDVTLQPVSAQVLITRRENVSHLPRQ
ncbi:MAG: AMIN domain-containing protein [Blastocatellia bacterium]